MRGILSGNSLKNAIARGLSTRLPEMVAPPHNDPCRGGLRPVPGQSRSLFLENIPGSVHISMHYPMNGTYHRIDPRPLHLAAADMAVARGPSLVHPFKYYPGSDAVLLVDSQQGLKTPEIVDKFIALAELRVVPAVKNPRPKGRGIMAQPRAAQAMASQWP